MLYKPDLKPGEKDIKYYTGKLISLDCPCGRSKQRGMAFCSKCYFKLPLKMRQALYKCIHEGFEAAYEAACEFLNNQDPNTDGVRGHVGAKDRPAKQHPAPQKDEVPGRRRPAASPRVP